jgi:hypothetical protein
LKHAIEVKLSHESRLRHEVVAERVFDEFERELNSVLKSEIERPSSAYDAPTDPSLWAPFVLGYFMGSPEHHRATFAPRLDDSNRSVLDVAARNLVGEIRDETAATSRSRPTAPVPPIASVTLPLGTEKEERIFAPASPRATQKPKSGADVINQLNRGAEQRRAVGAKKAKTDPMLDYGY